MVEFYRVETSLCHNVVLNIAKEIHFNVKKFQAQKISRFSRMTPKFAKLYSREKVDLADSRKLILKGHCFLGYFSLNRT